MEGRGVTFPAARTSDALAEIRAGETYITPNQLREFLNVATSAQAAARRAFLAREGIQVFGGPQVPDHGDDTTPTQGATWLR